MSKIIIQSGRIIDPVNQIDRVGNVYIAKGKIVSVGEAPEDFMADQIIDAQQRIVCPGFTDLSTRLREPGQTRKATFRSETQAAASAGITSMCLLPDTHPVIDNPAVAELIHDHAEKCGYKQIFPVAALTQKLQGQELGAMLTMKEAGCIAVSNANQAVSNLLVLRRAMEYATTYGLLLMYRPNDYHLSNNGCAHEGSIATRYGLPGIPEAAETIALAQCLELVELTGCRVHFSQISSRRSILKIQEAKKCGLNISADVAIHQLHLTENDIDPFSGTYHVIPPFRTVQDRQALRDAVAEGVIDAICSDHQPHDIDAKLGAFPETEPGISALETLLPLTLNLVKAGVLTLNQAITALSANPSKIIQRNSGHLTPGNTADICIFDPEYSWQINADTWKSQGINTPFWGHTLTGKVTHTLQTGKLLFSS